MIQIVQCWDDGVSSDIRLCELLRAHGAKASFNLNPGLHTATRGERWRYHGGPEVARLARCDLVHVYAGFTIANHTASHPHGTRIDPAGWRREVVDGRKQLQDLFGQAVEGFAYPFGDHDAATAQVVREAGHVYARTCENRTPCHPAPDAMMQPSDGHFKAADFWARYERAKVAGAGVFYFWGHSFEIANEAEWVALAATYARFNADPDAVWAELPAALGVS